MAPSVRTIDLTTRNKSLCDRAPPADAGALRQRVAFAGCPRKTIYSTQNVTHDENSEE
jgi:hypothetical protein